jgi:glycosyltransferase involved in cell wall biosynthesis
MRIAQVAPLFESVPPKLYGGTERVVSYLTEELVGQAHEVTLFASGDSATSARLVAGCPGALWRHPACQDALPHHVRPVEQVVRAADQFDVIHWHLDYVHFPSVGRVACPTVTTLHGQFYPPDEEAFFEVFSKVPLVSISYSQRRPMPRANWQATVYHGMPLETQTFYEGPGSYLAFLGRVSPEKGLDKAVAIARLAGLPLRVAAKIYPEERAYHEREIEPLLRASPWVEFVGEVGGDSKDAFLGGARALLFPIDWAEPFGLVMIESMATGTPVVAFRRGSVPEVITEGVTGYVVDDVQRAVEAVAKTSLIDRRKCRAAFSDRFCVTRMTNDYLDLYHRLLEGEACASKGTRRLSVRRSLDDPSRYQLGRIGPVSAATTPPRERHGRASQR